jgi:NADH-quinone oxidoreductase subunit J
MLLAAEVLSVDNVVFVVGAIVSLVGAFFVVTSRNPVHAALNLVVTLFGVAVLFVSLHATFLAAVQVIVYAGAIVVLFLFVIMLLGVDRDEAIEAEPLKAQRPVAVGLGALLLGELALLSSMRFRTPPPQAVAGSISPIDPEKSNVEQLAEVIFTRYLLAFEVTSVLLVIAVVGAVVLARKPGRGFGLLANRVEDDTAEVGA